MNKVRIDDERVESLRQTYGLEVSDFWELPQAKGKWCVKHSALEVVAVKAGIEFDPPVVVEADGANGVVAMVVTGYMMTEVKDGPSVRKVRRSEWSVGEASPKNSRNSYPWAISEKRAKDRVILKLAGIHGLVYSEDELDTPQKPVAAATVAGNGSVAVSAPDHLEAALGPSMGSGTLKSSAQAKRDGDWELLKQEIDACGNLVELNLLVASKAFLGAVAPIPKVWKEHLRDYIAETRKAFEDMTPPTAVKPNFDKMEVGE